MKICHIVTAFSRDEADDAITPWQITLLQGQKEKGHEPIVYAPAWKGMKYNEAFGIKTYRFRYFFKKFEIFSHDASFPSQVKKNKLYAILAFFVLLNGIIKFPSFAKKHNFDVVHVHWPFPLAVFTIFLPKRFKVIYTYYTAEIVFFKNLNFILRSFFKRLISRADKHIVISTYTKEIFHKNFPDFEVDIIPACYVFPQKFYKPTFPSDSPIKLLFVGRLVQRKGIKYLISAMSNVIDKVDVNLSIVGGGLIYDELVEQVKALDLQDHVTITGRVTNEELIQYYENSDLFILPACHDDNGDTEGLGMVLIEALSYGMPVIASRVGGIVDIIKDNVSGLLFSEKNPKEISDTILKILSDKELYLNLAEDGLLFVRDKFSSESVVQRMLEEYKDMIN